MGSDIYVGGRGRDTFVIGRNTGTDTIYDFQAGVDRIGLADGMQFEQLTIASGSTGTAIRLTQTNDLLAIVLGAQPTALTRSSFTLM